MSDGITAYEQKIKETGDATITSSEDFMQAVKSLNDNVETLMTSWSSGKGRNDFFRAYDGVNNVFTGFGEEIAGRGEGLQEASTVLATADNDVSAEAQHIGSQIL